jgi:hypothetical protein
VAETRGSGPRGLVLRGVPPVPGVADGDADGRGRADDVLGRQDSERGLRVHEGIQRHGRIPLGVNEQHRRAYLRLWQRYSPNVISGDGSSIIGGSNPSPEGLDGVAVERPDQLDAGRQRDGRDRVDGDGDAELRGGHADDESLLPVSVHGKQRRFATGRGLHDVHGNRSADHDDHDEHDDYRRAHDVNGNRNVYGYGFAFILGTICSTLPGFVSGLGGWLVMAYIARRLIVRALCSYIAARPDELYRWRGDLLRILSRRSAREIVRVIGHEARRPRYLAAGVPDSAGNGTQGDVR